MLSTEPHLLSCLVISSVCSPAWEWRSLAWDQLRLFGFALRQIPTHLQVPGGGIQLAELGELTLVRAEQHPPWAMWAPLPAICERLPWRVQHPSSRVCSTLRD